jgi:serine/threonine-protein phosphatase 2A regulatory subunit A
VDKNVSQQIIVPALIKMSSDRIPNIRFNVAKSFEGMRGEEIKGCLSKLSQDPDADVRYFSGKALAVV